MLKDNFDKVNANIQAACTRVPVATERMSR